MATSHGVDRSGAAGGTGATGMGAALNELADPNKDALVYWDDSAGGFVWVGFTGGDTPTDGKFIVGDGTNWVTESGATARTSLGAASLAGDTFTGDVTISKTSPVIALNAASDSRAEYFLQSGGTTAWKLTNVADAGLNDFVIFRGASAVENFRLLQANGNATFAGLLTLTAGQIAFPATANPSADANTLDDYEEGTWTPSVGGTATYNAQTGSYTKIGRILHFDSNLDINTIGTGSTTAISGLPFTAANTSQVTPRINGSSTAIVSAVGQITAGLSTITLVSRTAASAGDAVNAIFANAATVNTTGVYRT